MSNEEVSTNFLRDGEAMYLSHLDGGIDIRTKLALWLSKLSVDDCELLSQLIQKDKFAKALLNIVLDCDVSDPQRDDAQVFAERIELKVKRYRQKNEDSEY